MSDRPELRLATQPVVSAAIPAIASSLMNSRLSNPHLDFVNFDVAQDASLNDAARPCISLVLRLHYRRLSLKLSDFE